MLLDLYQVDAFSKKPFSGNPAAVCPLNDWIPDRLMQSIAAENNLAETAFFVRDGEGYRIRWFTPTTEVDLCGHATLATAYVIFEFLDHESESLDFQSRSGLLRVERAEGGRLSLDFPSRPAGKQIEAGDAAQALGAAPAALYDGHYLLAVFESEAEVRALAPDMRLLSRVGNGCMIVTAPGQDCDFVSRFFAPSHGIDEDPVTGSAHCTLIPYWAGRLGKDTFFARQVSARGGELWCSRANGRVRIAGHAALYLSGRIEI